MIHVALKLLVWMISFYAHALADPSLLWRLPL